MTFPKMTPRKSAAGRALIQWLGENSIGLIPLGAYLIVHSYSAKTFDVLICAPNLPPGTLISQCSALPFSAAQEICILTVVVAGLTVLSAFHLGPRKRHAPPTVFTHLLMLAAILSLIAGAIFYALFSARIAQDADTVTLWVLLTALFSSLCLALEGAILDT